MLDCSKCQIVQNVRLFKINHITTKVVTTKVTNYQSKSRLKYLTTTRFDYQETTTKRANDQNMATKIPATVYMSMDTSVLSLLLCCRGQKS